MKVVDCIVLGGGAAGLMCAAVAGQQGKTVLVLDHANKVGKKILMSGGGRCNFTNYTVDASHYLSQNTHFCKSALKRYSQYDFLQLTERHQLAFHEKSLGQLFCDNKSVDILNILLAECAVGKVEICCGSKMLSVAALPAAAEVSETNRFLLQTSQGAIACRSLVVATGGLSIPTMGASGLGYDIARQFGLRVTDLQPSLVPFTLSGWYLDLSKELAGVSIPISVTCGDTKFTENMLFTHRGLSGPAILQITNYWNSGDSVEINFLPSVDLRKQILQWQKDKSPVSVKNLLARNLPNKFVQLWLDRHEFSQTPLHQLSGEKLERFLNLFHRWQFSPGGTEGYRTAEVTRGGVDTDELSSKTFEAKKVPGLFFIGEVIDVTGWLGGYNFQWAWSSGYCAAQYV